MEVEGRAYGLGAILRRTWQGRQIEVVVEADGFRFDGRLFVSLSAVARAATGTRWNGPRFFGLRRGAPAVTAASKPSSDAARSTPARAPRRASSRRSTASTPSARPARPTSAARRRRAGRPCRPLYDDGGFSGGSHGAAGAAAAARRHRRRQIDIVVVYKIDRLTRSLTDFARMVELFERHQVSFVSVTQAFNTTTSMGRLTLNVLLSFAQFEREVTGERIRDKIAASKAKGMWMGGTLPLGYDLPVPGSRTLIPNADEAEIVRGIFAAYLQLGSVHALERQLRAEGIHSKRHDSAKGVVRGGGCFSRGALFHLLRNRLYLGEINHRDKTHPGLHPAIIDQAVFDAVQAKLDAQVRRPKTSDGGKAHAPLTGRIFDGDGQPMSPAFSNGRSGRLYRYYVSAPLQQGNARRRGDALPRRISAVAIETHLVARLSALVAHPPEQPLDLVLRLELHATDIVVFLPAKMQRGIEPRLGAGEVAKPDPDDPARFCLTLPFRVSTSRGRTELVAGVSSGSCPNPVLIGALRAAHASDRQMAVPAPRASPVAPTYRPTSVAWRVLAFLAPDLQEALLAGHQPARLNLADLTDNDLPVLWSEQRKMLGWAAKT